MNNCPKDSDGGRSRPPQKALTQRRGTEPLASTSGESFQRTDCWGNRPWLPCRRPTPKRSLQTVLLTHQTAQPQAVQDAHWCKQRYRDNPWMAPNLDATRNRHTVLHLIDTHAQERGRTL